APAFANRIAPLVHRIAPLMLLVAVVPVLFIMWPRIVALIRDGTLVALVAFAAIGLLVGHLLGGPDPDDRTVLALASAAHHPAIAITLARINAPDDQGVPAAILLYLLVCAVVTFPYVAWRKRSAHAAHAHSH
ncbi:MAG: Na+-dependent transporter, partial [Vitreimonas sp.]